ncbi:MAG: ATP-binding protein [Myxococcaceae bacterium]
MAGSPLLQRLMHPAVAANAELRRRATIVLAATAFALTFVTVQSVVMVAARGLTLRLVPSALFVVVALACIGLVRARPTPNAAGHVLFGLSTLLVAVAVSGEEALHAGSVAWFGVVCATAVMSLGLRAGAGWLAATLAITVTTEVLRRLGVIEPWLFPTATMTTVRAVGLTLAFFVLAALFEWSRRTAVEEVERATRGKSQFLANVSHELRTPMNGVLGLTELLLRTPLEAEQREHLELLQRSGQSLVVLLNELLDMSKVEAGKMQLDPVDFDLAVLLADLKALHEPVAQSRGLQLAFKVPATLPPALRGDAMRLRQVLTNLLSNAIKFTERGSVLVEVRSEPGERWHFAVTDTGIGIAKDTLPHLFTAFSQAEVGTTRRFGGTGLGLALCKELVTLMGGELQAQSELGRGTTMAFTVPLAASLAALVVPEATSAGTVRADLAPVLVVDDNPINLRVACGLVEKAGYRTVQARNGAEAVALAKAQPLTLILMDCHMPLMDGFEATEKIRALEGEAALVPIVALTASAMPDELMRCRQSGMNDCLIKPVTLDQLAATLRRMVMLRELTSSTSLT